MRGFLLMLGLGILSGSSTALADTHPDFSGTWLMDLNDPASTPMGPILQAQGASWMERRAADAVAVKQVITQTKDAITIHASSTLRENTEVIKLDGSVEVRTTDRLGKVEARSFWDKDGKTVVTVMKYKTKDGKQAEWSIRRYLTDGGKKIQVDHKLSFDDGRVIKSTRVLLRQ